jgi:uncharacterized phiE125 gp8 family phage protein
MGLKLITAPDEEPLFVDDVKAHCRINGDDDDQLIESMITAARQMAETQTKRALITQTWDLYLDKFPCDYAYSIILPKPTLQSVTYLKYIDTDGVLQTLSADNYKVDNVTEPARIVPAYGYSWPSTRDEINAVVIRFVCGYGDDEESVPSAIKDWMKIKISTMYEYRDEFISGTIIQPLPNRFVDSMLDYIVYM